MNQPVKFVRIINGEIVRMKNGKPRFFEVQHLRPDLTQEELLKFVDSINDSGILRPELKVQLWEDSTQVE